MNGCIPFLDRLVTMPADTLCDAQRFGSIPAAVADASTQMTPARIAAPRRTVINTLNEVSLFVARPAKPDADTPINQRLSIHCINACWISQVMNSSMCWISRCYTHSTNTLRVITSALSHPVVPLSLAKLRNSCHLRRLLHYRRSPFIHCVDAKITDLASLHERGRALEPQRRVERPVGGFVGAARQ